LILGSFVGEQPFTCKSITVHKPPESPFWLSRRPIAVNLNYSDGLAELDSTKGVDGKDFRRLSSFRHIQNLRGFNHDSTGLTPRGKLSRRSAATIKGLFTVIKRTASRMNAPETPVHLHASPRLHVQLPSEELLSIFRNPVHALTFGYLMVICLESLWSQTPFAHMFLMP
jgi:hypothetical protein